MFCFHSSIFIRRFNSRKNSLQIFTTKGSHREVKWIDIYAIKFILIAETLMTPAIALCPTKYFRLKISICFQNVSNLRRVQKYEGPRDFIRLISMYFSTSVDKPMIGNKSILSIIKEAFEIVDDLRSNFAAKKISTEDAFKESNKFVSNYRKILPECGMLMNV